MEKLNNSHVLIAGCGGLGNIVSLYLSAAGVHNITLADFDKIDYTNLNRQIAFREKDIGKQKIDALKDILIERNSNCTINLLYDDIDTVEDFSQFDLIIDCLDNSYSKIKLHSKCKQNNKTSIFGSAIRNYGQVCILKNSCINCAIPDLITTSDSCELFGVYGPMVGIIGSYQCYIALKYLSGYDVEEKLINISDLDFYEISLDKCNHIDNNIEEIEIEYELIIKEKNYQIFDIREYVTEEEYLMNHVFNENDLVTTSNIYVLCDTGQESILKAIDLKSKGYNAKSIKGGIKRIFNV